MPLLVSGAAVYLWAAAAIGMLLGTLARSMAQFALLVIMVIIPGIMLSGGMGAVESQPELVQKLTLARPTPAAAARRSRTHRAISRSMPTW